MKTKPLRTAFFCAGALLIAAALCLTGFNIYEDGRGGRASAEALAVIRPALPSAETLPEPVAPEISATEPLPPLHVREPYTPMPTQKINGQQYIGVVDVPAVNISLPVISEWSIARLKLGPCRYTGSAYLDDLIISGHNNLSHFGYLVEVEPGDKVYFTDMDGNVFTYEVVELEVLKGTDVEKMVSGDWDLTLFTCYIDGSNRLTVRCVRAAE